MSRKEFFFQVRISHVLLFTAICNLFTDSVSYITLTNTNVNRFYGMNEIWCLGTDVFLRLQSSDI
jgi:hypothetical protein